MSQNNNNNNFNFDWTQYKAYEYAKSEHEGNLRMSCENDSNHLYEHEALIAVKKWGEVSWEPLGCLSAANWSKHRTTIAASIADIFSDSTKIKDSVEDGIILDETLEMFSDLFNEISPAEKKKFVRKYQSYWFGRTHCLNCLIRCNADTKKKCINHKCGGLCNACHEEIGQKCPGCHADQSGECPVCQEKKTSDHLCKSDTCSHYVCWECYGKSFRSGFPIQKCPLSTLR